MKQCKALLIKEWRTHWGTLLTPLWFTAGVYVIGILGYLISLIKGNTAQFSMGNMGAINGYESLLLYGSSFASVVMLGAVSLISAIILADSMINGGFKRRCEILHLSQPVPLIKIVGIKYLIITLGIILIWGILSLVNSLVLSVVQGYLVKASPYYGMIGWLQGWLQMSLTILLLSSMYWFWAGVFKRKSFFMGTLVILGIQAAISILNYTAGLSIPSLLGYIGQLCTVQADVVPYEAISVGLGIQSIISAKWAALFSGFSAVKVLYSALFFAGGYWLYKRRELS